MNNQEPKTFPDMSDNGNGYPNTTKWDLQEQLDRRLEEESEQEPIEEEWESNTENNF